MDCVSCDKCRLNGKVQVRGLATAMKVLFVPESTKLVKSLKAGEIVSLVQLLSKLSESLLIIDKFTEMEANDKKQWHLTNRAISAIIAVLAIYVVSAVLGPRKKERKVE